MLCRVRALYERPKYVKHLNVSLCFMVHVAPLKPVLRRHLTSFFLLQVLQEAAELIVRGHGTKVGVFMCVFACLCFCVCVFVCFVFLVFVFLCLCLCFCVCVFVCLVFLLLRFCVLCLWCLCVCASVFWFVSLCVCVFVCLRFWNVQYSVRSNPGMQSTMSIRDLTTLETPSTMRRATWRTQNTT